MRIRLVTQWYPPEPAAVPQGIAHGLAARGHAVDVLTGFPNYPTGRLAEGYSVRPYRREVDRGIEGEVVVHRAPLFPSHDTRAVMRMTNYASFAVGATAVAVSLLPRPDVWLTYSSPATAALPALTARLVDRVAVVTGTRHRTAHAQIVQDLWPDSVLEAGFVTGPRVNRVMESGLRAVCDRVYAGSDAVGVISPGMRGILVGRGVQEERLVDTPNAVNASVLPRADRGRRHELGLPERGRLFVYAGNLGELQNLPALVQAFAQVPGAELALIGPGVTRDRIQQQIIDEQIPNVRLLPPQPPDRIGDFLACADALVVSLADTALLRATMPSKVASCLGTARPVLAHAAGDVADVVTAAGGLACRPGDLRAVTRTIAAMSRWSDDEFVRRGDAARAYYEAYLSTERCRDGLDTLVRRAARVAGLHIAAQSPAEGRPS